MGDSVIAHIKPQQVLTLGSQVWNNAVASGFTIPSSFCPASGYTDLTFTPGSSHPASNPAAIISGDCIRGHIISPTSNIPQATQDWGEARASNVSSFTMRAQSFDGYNFSVTTCGVL